MLEPVHQGRLVDPDWAPRVVSPAYDALAPEERAAHLARNPHTFLHVTRSRGDGSLDDAERLAEARRALARLIEQGAFGPPRDRGLFLYRLADRSHSQIGIVGELPVAALDDGRILRHESTRPDRVESLARHLLEVGTMSSPVALAYRRDTTVDELVARHCAGPADVDVEVSGVRQQVWAVTDQASELLDAFQRHVVYIIDGHHRSDATAWAARRRPGLDRMLVVLFPHDQLRIRPFHRLIGGEAARLAASRWTDLLSPLDGHRRPSGQHEAIVRLDQRWWRLELPPLDGGRVSDRLAVTRLQADPLARLGITDPRTHPDLDTVPDSRPGIVEFVDRTDGVAVLLDAVPLEELFAVSDAGETLPPKSTSFEPKVRSGLFVRLI